MIINQKHKFVFISIAKTACTSIRRRLTYDEDNSSQVFEQDPPPEIYHMFYKDMIKIRPEIVTYFKFCFVRNPYDRVYSTYLNLKYADDHSGWADPIKKFLNFEDFILNFQKTDCVKFIHLQPQFDYISINNKSCMDFIGRFEKLRKDMIAVEKKININHIPLKKIRTTEEKFKLEDPKIYTQYMKDIIYEFYKDDFINFGYEK